MKINRLLTSAVAIVSMIGIAPAYAAKNTASVGTLSIAKGASKLGAPVRATTKVKKTNSIGPIVTVILGVLAVGGIAGGIAAATSRSNTPTSP